MEIDYLVRISITDDNTHEKLIRVSAPISAGDEVVIDGFNHMVFTVTHYSNGGMSVVECDRMDVTPPKQ